MNFVTNLQSAEQVVPAIAAFHDPAASLEARILLPLALLLAARLDVRDVAASCGRATQLRVVVSLVAAQMLVRLLARRRSSNDEGVQRGIELFHVVPVCTGERNGQRNALGVGELMPLGAQFAAIRRVFSGLIPPLTGAETVALSIDWNRQSTPRRSS